MSSCTECTHHNASSDDSQTEGSGLVMYDSTSIADAAALEAAHLKIVGGAGTGKTEALVKKAARLIQDGVDPSHICIIVNTADAAKAFTAKLIEAAPKAQTTKVTTIEELCVSILDTADARSYTGRIPRLLNNAEYNFLLEDIKTLGQKPGRLKKMLNYFYYQWSQLNPEEEWLLPQEESSIRNALDNHLRSRGAMISEEVSPLSVAYLKHGIKAGKDKLFAAVLVDDYQNLSKASQIVCDLIARDSLTITGNENQFFEGRDKHPFEEGFTCFENHYEDAVCVQLFENQRCPANVAAMGNALCKQGGLSLERSVTIAKDSPSAEALQIKWTSPSEEISGLVTYVRNLLAKSDDLDASDIFIVAPNKVWARMLEKSIARYRLGSDVVLAGQPLGGDPRSYDRCRDMVAYTKLNLLADAEDVVAWRSWCGFDDYLCYGGAWCRLEQWASEKEMTLLDALASLSEQTEEPFLEAHVLSERYGEGQAFIAAHSTKKGFALAKAFGESKSIPVFSALIEPMEGDEDAATLYKRAANHVLNPQFNDLPRIIKIGSYESLQGLSPRVLIISGLIDGFMPSRDCFDFALLEEERVEIANKQRRIYYNSLTKTSDKIVLSTIQKADLETAEKYRMEVRRVKMEKGQRLAMLSPSVFIAESGDAVPGAVSGQQFLSDLS